MMKILGGPGDLHFLTWQGATADARSEIETAERALTRHLNESSSGLLHQRFYLGAHPSQELLETVSNDPARPSPTWITTRSDSRHDPISMHAITARLGDSDSHTVIRHNGIPCGIRITGYESEYLYLSDVSRLLPKAHKTSGALETEAALDFVESVLQDHGWAFTDICRTWFYLRDILGWYNEFNAARNQVFERLGLFADASGAVIPASTGIEGRNHHGSWCTLDLLAARRLPGHSLAKKRLVNPKQNEASEYGSAFSRALALTSESARYIAVSGTASIDEQGNSTNQGDFVAQVNETLSMIDALLRQGGATLEHIVQATAFIKRASDMPVWRSLVANSPIASIPVISTLADVCRDELLFELDATALVD